MSEPTTEAGKRLLVTFRSMYEDAEWLAAAEFDIAAIEAEARAQGALHAHLVNEGDIEQARADAINELEAKTVKHFLAIADEARAAVLRELREEVEGMNLKASWVLRAAVLAAIDRRLP